jgi:hypothetical protein
MRKAIGKSDQFRALPRQCVYCGQPTADGREHVPPKAVFVRPFPPNLITVPCCSVCNGRWGKLDEEFRPWLSFTVGIDTDERLRFWRESALRGLTRNRRLKEEILDGFTRTLVRNPATNEWGHATLLDKAVYDSMIRRITRGLYFREYREILPERTAISISRRRHFNEMSEFMKYARRRDIGTQFAYAVLCADERPVDTLWMYIFHQRECALAATGALADDPVQERDLHDSSFW